MSQTPHRPEDGPASAENSATSTDPAGPAADSTRPERAGKGAGRGSTTRDPLRGSRTSGLWIAVAVLVVLLVLLAIFVLQNTQSVNVSFLGWSGSAPLAATLLIAAAAGLVIALAAGSLRILQLRRRVKRARR